MTPPSSTYLEEYFKKQPLLQDFGIITTPETLGESGFRELTWAIHYGVKNFTSVRLRVAGYGGGAYYGLGLYALLQQYPKVTGELIGFAESAHSIIWCGCRTRLVADHSILGVHEAWAMAGMTTVQDSRLNLDTMLHIKTSMAKVYANSCKNPEYGIDYWMKHMGKGTPQNTKICTHDELINKYKMGDKLYYDDLDF